jgi:predicted amidohydrolase YtcJ
MASDLYAGGRMFTADSRRWADALVVTGDRIAYVGDLATARRIAGDDRREIDLGGRLVLPGFVDAHAHVLGTGEAAGQADLWGATDLAGIQQAVAAWAGAHPDAPRVLAQGWNHAAIPGGEPARAMLDAVVPDRPAYAQAYDYHSIWLNTAALDELGIDARTVAPSGGRIATGDDGSPTGYVDETAMQQIVWPRLEAFTTNADRDAQLQTVLAGYRRTGVTAATDMGLDEDQLAALLRAESAGTLTTRITAHWKINHSDDPDENLEQVRRAIRLAELHRSHLVRVTGIKVMIDGTVDGCTAALKHPYADGSNAGPVWPLEHLAPVVSAADAAGLQVAMHAIGDDAVRIAVDAVEHAVRVNGPRPHALPRRHRIEHLEVTDHDDIERLAALGVVASMQPVHADASHQRNWRARLGDAARIDRGFPWPEMTDAGARLAFGTDSPTAPYAPLHNMFVATTRRSAFDPSQEPNVARYALPLAEAIEHGTRDAAYSCRGDDDFGRLAAGLFADFIVVDRDVFAAPLEELLDAEVVRTVLGGREVFASRSEEARA